MNLDHLVLESEIPEISAHKELSPSFRIKVCQSVESKSPNTKAHLNYKLLTSPLNR